MAASVSKSWGSLLKMSAATSYTMSSEDLASPPVMQDWREEMMVKNCIIKDMEFTVHSAKPQITYLILNTGESVSLIPECP